MISILFIILSIWVGFFIEDQFDLLEGNFWVKSSSAIIVGSMLSTWLVFVISLFIGFNKVALFAGLLIMSLYIAYRRSKQVSSIRLFKKKVLHDRAIALPYAIVLLFVMPFFVFGMWETETGDIMYLGNYTDISYHISIVSSFLEQISFPPENPQCAGANMSYHFLVDFHSAILSLGGFNLFLSVIIPQILFAFALSTMLYYFYWLVLRNELSIFFSVTLLIMGHIAFFNFLFALLGHTPPGIRFNINSFHSIRELLLFPFFNFLDPVINYFHPQRPFLFAFSLSLIVLSGIYRRFLRRKDDLESILGLCLLVSLTPLFHIHTFLILTPIFIVASFYMCRDIKRTFLTLLPLSLAAIQIWFILSQPKALGFSGFDVHELAGGLIELDILGSQVLSRLVFWIRVAGFPLILGITGFVFYFINNRKFSLSALDGGKNTILLVFFTIPFLFFLLINFYRFSPNWGDSNKFFLYFDLMLCIFAGKLLCSWFEKSQFGKIVAIATILIAAILPSSIEAYGIFVREGSLLFSACDRNVANWIKVNTAKNAIFLTSDDVIHYVPSLSGRRVINGAYTWQTGFKKPETDSDVRKIYMTGDQRLLEKYGVTHILVGPHEIRKYLINNQSMNKYKIVYDQECRGDRHKIFDIRHKGLQSIAKQPLLLTEHISVGKMVFLSDMIPIRAVQNHGKVRFDSNFNMEPIFLNGRRYKKGLGSHANSEIIFDLSKRFTYFESYVGLDDTEDSSPGSIVFKVFIDGEITHETKVMRWNSQTQHIKVDLKGVKELRLIVEDAGDGDTCDHASWADAMIY